MSLNRADPVERQAFDEQVYCRPYFRVLDPLSEDVEHAWTALRREHPVLLGDVRTSVSDRASLRKMVDLGFRRVCTQVTLACEASGKMFIDDEVNIAPSLDMSVSDLQRHGRGFVFCRFVQDPCWPAELGFEAMRRWMANSISGRREVAFVGRNVCTFAERDDQLVIDLLSVLDEGGGIGRRLVAAVIAEAGRRGLARVLVTTEAENTRAMRLYVHSGFSPVSASACLHHGVF